MKTLALAAVALLAALFIGRLVVTPKIAERGFERMVTQRIGVNPLTGLDDGLHVYMCGAGSPLADPKRSGPCIGVIAGRKLFVFDAGMGGSQNLGQMGFPLVATSEIFLTHLHSDHLDGLGRCCWGRG